MHDAVVPDRKSFSTALSIQSGGRSGLDAWIEEGDAAGEPETGQSYYFHLGHVHLPDIELGERVYIVYNGCLRGYAPLTGIEEDPADDIYLVRQGGAVAVTIPEVIRSFRGWRYRWWERSQEVAFPDWENPHASPFLPNGAQEAL